MFMLESHLSPEQNRIVSLVQAVSEKAGLNVFLTGGAVRDMLAGFPIRGLDFTVEGNGLKLAQMLAGKEGAKIVSTDEQFRSADLVFFGGLTVEVSSAHTRRYPKSGGKPVVHTATVREDLLRRDFTINAIALSLNPASRGLLLDPTNGQDDLLRRELRATGNYTMYEDPTRLLRMQRLRVRLGFEIEPRTLSQYQNAREAQLEQQIPTRALLAELRQMAEEPNPAALVEILDKEGLMTLFLPAFAGPKLNLAGLAKLVKARQSAPVGIEFPVRNLGLFLNILCEKLSAKERAQLIKRLGMPKAVVDAWQQLDQQSRKLDSALKSARLNRPSKVYEKLREAAGEQVLYLFLKSPHRLVQDRIRNYLQRYALAAHEVSEREVQAYSGVAPDSPEFPAVRQDYIAAKLDGRIRIKPEPTPEPAPAPAAAPRRA